jgi:RNA polymerase sigma-70 factor (ECF subfamily)
MKKKEQLTDLEIIQRVISGDKGMYELIVRRYNPYLYKIGRSYNYNHEDTEDLMQDTYVDAFKALATFESKANFKTWLSRIMLNNCYRKKEKFSYKNETSSEMNENSKPMFQHSNQDTGQLVNRNELNLIVEQTLQRIPENYRMVFSLREINDMSISETAELLSMNEANVKTSLSRAKNLLRNELINQYSPAEFFDYHAVFCDPMTERVMKCIDKL